MSNDIKPLSFIVEKSINAIKNRKFKITLFGDMDNYNQTLDYCGLRMENQKNVNFINTGTGEPVEIGRVTANAGKIAYKSMACYFYIVFIDRRWINFT